MTLLLESGSAVLVEDGGGLLLEDGTSSGGGTVAQRIGTPPLNSSLRDITLTAPTYESLECEVYCSADPTAVDPGFAVTTEGTLVTGSTTYSTGAWSSNYGTDGWVFARTPTLGSAGTIVTTTGTRLWLWIQATAGTEIAVWRVGTVIVL